MTLDLRARTRLAGLLGVPDMAGGAGYTAPQLMTGFILGCIALRPVKYDVDPSQLGFDK